MNHHCICFLSPLHALKLNQFTLQKCIPELQVKHYSHLLLHNIDGGQLLQEYEEYSRFVRESKDLQSQHYRVSMYRAVVISSVMLIYEITKRIKEMCRNKEVKKLSPQEESQETIRP